RFDPHLVALLPAVIRIDGDPVFALAAAERVGLIERRLHTLLLCSVALVPRDDLLRVDRHHGLQVREARDVLLAFALVELRAGDAADFLGDPVATGCNVRRATQRNGRERLPLLLHGERTAWIRCQVANPAALTRSPEVVAFVV